ncbi:hypothetical protein CPB86DRAFT_590233 [Serendipita vermifera]|nr:hypothetical protein CPB86DRAFT_590233 [Serendipita vermifera]
MHRRPFSMPSTSTASGHTGPSKPSTSAAGTANSALHHPPHHQHQHQHKHSRRYWNMISTLVGEVRTRGYGFLYPFVTSETHARPSHSKRRPASLPVDLYRPILLELAKLPDGRKELLGALTVSKAMAHEVQKIIYHSLTLSPDVPQPAYLSDTVALMVRSVQIRLGNRYRAAKHTRWCMELLPRLLRLEQIDIRGRGWEVSVFDSCLPRTWDSYEGITSVKSFTFDGSIDLPLIRFLAAQRSLSELEIVSSMSVPFSSTEVLEIVSMPYDKLSKVTIPHEYAKAIVRIAPNLKHLTLTLDINTTPHDLSVTLSQLPRNLQTLILNTTRRDLLPAHAFLPLGLRTLSTVFVQHEADRLLQYLKPLKHLENVILNVCQPAVPTFINPFAPGAAPPSPTSVSSSTPLQGVDDRVVDRFVTELKLTCPSVKTVQLDDQVFKRTGSLWAEEKDGSMSRRESYDITSHREGSAARQWRMSI